MLYSTNEYLLFAGYCSGDSFTTIPSVPASIDTLSVYQYSQHHLKKPCLLTFRGSSRSNLASRPQANSASASSEEQEPHILRPCRYARRLARLRQQDLRLYLATSQLLHCVRLHLVGSTPRRFAPRRYGSGCGFPCSTSSAYTAVSGATIPAFARAAVA